MDVEACATHDVADQLAAWLRAAMAATEEPTASTPPSPRCWNPGSPDRLRGASHKPNFLRCTALSLPDQCVVPEGPSEELPETRDELRSGFSCETLVLQTGAQRPARSSAATAGRRNGAPCRRRSKVGRSLVVLAPVGDQYGHRRKHRGDDRHDDSRCRRPQPDHVLGQNYQCHTDAHKGEVPALPATQARALRLGDVADGIAAAVVSHHAYPPMHASTRTRSGWRFDGARTRALASGGCRSHPGANVGHRRGGRPRRERGPDGHARTSRHPAAE